MYFESSLVNYKIQSLSFQEYHTDPKQIIAFSNKDTLFQATQDNNVFKSLKKEDLSSTNLTNTNIEYFAI